MPIELNIYRYNHSIDFYRISFSEEYRAAKILTDSFFKFKNDPIVFNSNIWETLGYMYSLKKKYNEQASLKLFNLHIDSEEKLIKKRISDLRKENKSMPNTDKNDDDDDQIDFQKLVNVGNYKGKINSDSIVANMKTYKVDQVNEKGDDLLANVDFYPDNLQLSCNGDERKLLRYMNSFYEYCDIRIGTNFRILQFNISRNSTNDITVTVVYLFMRIAYKMEITERFYAKIENYVYYNNLISISGNFILKKMSEYVVYNFDGKGDFFCPVCFESDVKELESPPKRLWKCGHTICQGCFREWYKVGDKCPFCNCRFSSFHRLDNDVRYCNMVFTKYWQHKTFIRNSFLLIFLYYTVPLYSTLLLRGSDKLSMRTELLSLLKFICHEGINKKDNSYIGEMIKYDRDTCIINKPNVINRQLTINRTVDNYIYSYWKYLLEIPQILTGDNMFYLDATTFYPIRKRRDEILSFIFIMDYTFKEVVKKFKFEKIKDITNNQIIKQMDSQGEDRFEILESYINRSEFASNFEKYNSNDSFYQSLINKFTFSPGPTYMRNLFESYNAYVEYVESLRTDSNGKVWEHICYIRLNFSIPVIFQDNQLEYLKMKKFYVDELKNREKIRLSKQTVGGTNAKLIYDLQLYRYHKWATLNDYEMFAIELIFAILEIAKVMHICFLESKRLLNNLMDKLNESVIKMMTSEIFGDLQFSAKSIIIRLIRIPILPSLLIMLLTLLSTLVYYIAIQSFNSISVL